MYPALAVAPSDRAADLRLVETVADFKRIVHATRVGDVVALHLYSPFLDQHQLKTVRVEDR